MIQNKLIFEKLSTEVVKKLLKIDYNFYRNSQIAFNEFSDQQILEHYANFGYSEGRISSPQALRENFFNIKNEKVLEIGPFTNPICSGKNVKYFDVLSYSDLRNRAQNLKLNTNNIPYINFISKNGDLDSISETFDIIISSHNLEHQVNLIKHLNQASKLLNPGGSYKMIVPDCAYCFDANIYPSMISEVIMAYFEKKKNHSIDKIIEHRALTTSNDSLKHWEDKKLGLKRYELINVERIKFAIEEFRRANGNYIDVHSWQFRPHTLSDILISLIELKMINYKKVNCYGTVYGRNGFCIEILK